jgi:hypothetical protein
MNRVLDAWAELTHEQRLASGAAMGLFLTMFLPWYQQNAVVNASRGAPLVSRDLDAFAVFSFVEAAVLLVAAAVLALLFARAERRTFHLPGSDGALVMLAGGWAALLLVLRLFDKPGITSKGIAANVGIQWGIFFALAAAGLLTYAGSRMRAGRELEAPLTHARARRSPGRPTGHGPSEGARSPSPDAYSRSAAMPEAAAEDLPGAAATTRPRYPPAPASAPSTAGAQALRRARRPVRADSEQLSFEEDSTNPEGPPSQAE